MCQNSIAGAPSRPPPKRAKADASPAEPTGSPESALQSAEGTCPASLLTAHGAGPRPDPPLRQRGGEAAPGRPPHLAEPHRRALPRSERVSVAPDWRGWCGRRLGLRLDPRSIPRGWGSGDPHCGSKGLTHLLRAPPSTLRAWWVCTVAGGCPELGCRAPRPRRPLLLTLFLFIRSTLHSLKPWYFYC